MRTGTIFGRSHVPLHKWLHAMSMVVTARKGISSLQLAKEIGVQQKTAWFLLQRIRQACGDATEMARLRGMVETDELHVGGKEHNRHGDKKDDGGRGTSGQQPVPGIRQRGGHAVDMAITGTTKAELQARISQRVGAGSTVCTDEQVS